MTSRVPPPVPDRLSGVRVQLRPIADWDIPEILIAHEDDRGLASALGLARPPSGAQLGAEIERASEDWTAGTLKLTILRPGSNDCAGRLTVVLDPTGENAATGFIWLAPQHRGRGLARAAWALAGDWLARGAGIEQLQCSEDGAGRG